MNTTKRDAILLMAARLFRQKGYSVTTMRDLAGEMGIKAASLYNHIHSKQELLSILLLDIADTFIEGMSIIEQKQLSALEKIEALIGLHVKVTMEKPNAITLINFDWRHLEEPTYSKFIEMRTDYEQRFKKIILEGIEQEQLNVVDPDIALFSILSTMRWLYMWQLDKERIQPQAVEQQLKICLIGGLKK